MLTEAEREHLFMLALGRPPEVRYRAADSVTPRLQRLLDGMPASPAIIKTATWDVVAWNRAAALVLTDYGALPPRERNILRLVFGNDRVRRAQEDWESTARFVVGAFRADAVRAGAVSEVGQLVTELCATSPEFAALWGTITCASTARAPSGCTTPFWARWSWNIRALRSMVVRTWA